jgi:GNAT superfamily N-acetyltransferase
MSHPTRLFRADDSEACCAIIADCLELMAGLNPAAREFIMRKNTPESLAAELLPLRAQVYCVSGVVVGLGALDRDAAKIKRVYVVPGWQGHGIGRALMDALEDEARAAGIETIALEASLNAVAFYERIGYITEKSDRMTIGEATLEFVLMRKLLG